MFAFAIWPSMVLGQNVLIPSYIDGCYTGTQFYPSNRLPNALDNLIYLIEEVETAFVAQSLPIDASTVATVLLRKFQLNGIMDYPLSGGRIVDTNEVIQQQLVMSLLPNATFTFPDNILTQQESCSLHWMLSTSINNTADYMYDYYSSQPRLPKLNGAISAGRYGTLSGGPLLAGIAASSILRQFTVQDLLTVEQQSQVDAGLLSQSMKPVHGTTVSAELGQTVILYASTSIKTGYRHPTMGPDGTWNGTNCATTFSLNSNDTTAATQAELLGATDGMIIGDFLYSNYYSVNDLSTPTLSQTLRSYYGRGLLYNSRSACDRNQYAQNMMNDVVNSGTAFGIVYKAKGGYNSEYPFPNYASVATAMSNAVSNYSATYVQSGAFSCDLSIQNFQCQTQNDIFIVMDTSTEASVNNFQEQKNFIGALIGRVGVYPNDSHTEILTFSSTSPLIPFNTEQSGAYVRCQVQWSPNLYPSTTDVTRTITTVQSELRKLRDTQRNRNYAQVPGKVVIFIYLRSSVSDGDNVQKAMKSLWTEFPDVTTLSVGSNKQALKYFVTQDSDAFQTTGEQLSSIVDNIVKRFCTVPSSLEYKDCRTPDVTREKELIGDTYVYPDTYQWIAVNQQAMNLSSNLILNFVSAYGKAQACVSRSISPQTPTMNCFEVSESARTYTVGGTCGNYKSLNSCPSVYIGIKGQSGTVDKCTERACHSWNQVKVSVRHEGLKCSSCRFLSVFPIVSGCLLWILSCRQFY